MNNLNNNNWISLAIYGNKFEPLLTNIVAAFIEKNNKKIANFMFNRSSERGNNILLMFLMNKEGDKELIKTDLRFTLNEYLKQNPFDVKTIEAPVTDWFLPFQNNHIEYNNNFLFDIMETGGLKASYLAQDLLNDSSRLLLNFFENEEEWIPESAIGTALQVQLALIASFSSNIEDISYFYNWAFDNLLKKIKGETDEFKKTLLNGLEENFEEQKESIAGFVHYLISAFAEKEVFEQEWLNKWFDKCRNYSAGIKNLQNDHTYFTPENFEVNYDLSVNLSQQQLWPVIEYNMRFINSQMRITDGIELNLLFTLMRSTQFIHQEDL